jgi:hypothetical protein
MIGSVQHVEAAGVARVRVVDDPAILTIEDAEARRFGRREMGVSIVEDTLCMASTEWI